MRKLKHRFSLGVKPPLLEYCCVRDDDILMDKNYNKTEAQRLALAMRLKIAIATLGRGGKRRIAESCGVSEQAITGWLKTGKVDKAHIVTIARITRSDLHYLLTGTSLPKPEQTEDLTRFKKISLDKYIPFVPLERLRYYFDAEQNDKGVQTMIISKELYSEINPNNYPLLSVGVQSSKDFGGPQKLIFAIGMDYKSGDGVIVEFSDGSSKIMIYVAVCGVKRFEPYIGDDFSFPIDIPDGMQFTVKGVLLATQPEGIIKRR